jgi:hypothetical protein
MHVVSEICHLMGVCSCWLVISPSPPSCCYRIKDLAYRHYDCRCGTLVPLVEVFDVSLFVVEVSEFVEHHCCHYDQCTCSG